MVNEGKTERKREKRERGKESKGNKWVKRGPKVKARALETPIKTCGEVVVRGAW